MSEPKISVCMPIFNGMPYLKESLESVIRQDFENFEIIISIDRSNDGTIEYINTLKSERVKVIINDKPGLFSNLNNAITHSSGEFIQIFCQDDIMMPDMLSKQMAEFKNNESVVMAIAREFSVGHDGQIGQENTNSKDDSPMSHNLYLWRAAHYGSISSNISCIMARRDAIFDCGMFDQRFKFAGDVDFYNKISFLGLIKIGFEPCVYIRGHVGQTSRKPSAIIGFLTEERLINEGFWKKVLSTIRYNSILKFRAKTRGAIHIRSAFREFLSFNILHFIRIIKEVYRTYGLIYPFLYCSRIKKSWPDPEFSPEEMQLIERCGSGRPGFVCAA